VILLFADVEELAVIGPWEVLSSWTRSLRRMGTRCAACPRQAACFSAPTTWLCKRTILSLMRGR